MRCRQSSLSAGKFAAYGLLSVLAACSSTTRSDSRDGGPVDGGSELDGGSEHRNEDETVEFAVSAVSESECPDLDEMTCKGEIEFSAATDIDPIGSFIALFDCGPAFDCGGFCTAPATCWFGTREGFVERSEEITLLRHGRASCWNESDRGSCLYDDAVITVETSALDSHLAR